jgi:Tfp pilus assembly major pilin PilA
MTRKLSGKLIYALMLGLLAVFMTACCCEEDPPPDDPPPSEPDYVDCGEEAMEGAGDAFSEMFAEAISIKKTSDVQSYTEAGQVINYTYTISNIYEEVIEFIVVEDDKLDISCPASQNLVANQPVICTGSYTVVEEDVTAGKITNTASVDASVTREFSCSTDDEIITKDLPISIQVSTSLTIYIEPLPALWLEKESDPLFHDGFGRLVDYTYTLTNYGNVPLSSPFTIDDDKVPEGWFCDDQEELLPGNSMLCHAYYMIDGGIRWSITNTAIACGEFMGDKICSDGASATVLFRQPYVPQAPPPPPLPDSPPPPVPYCGDGVVNQSSEQCEPPNVGLCNANC